MRITVLAGGVGSARFLAGLARIVPPGDLTVVVNTGDDERIRGLHICPDIDTVLYHIAGVNDWDRGWGMRDESYVVNDRYQELTSAAGDVGVDAQEWFTLGDRDLATNLFRARVLDAGRSLTEATAAIARALGVEPRILPASDDPVRTYLHTERDERLDFQEYFVKRHQEPPIAAVSVDADHAAPAPGVLDAIAGADLVIIPPSNPLLSVGPMLAVPGIRETLAETSARRVGVSPIVGGRALKGPADLLMAALGHEVSPVGVAGMYEGLLDVFVIDDADAGLADRIEALGLRVAVCDTIMRSADGAAAVAKAVLAVGS